MVPLKFLIGFCPQKGVFRFDVPCEGFQLSKMIHNSNISSR